MTKQNHSFFSLLQIGLSIHHVNKLSERRFGMSLVQWCLLKQLLDRPASSAFVLAKATGVQPSTLTQTLKRLERKGYIFITEDPRDSRKKLISITRSGMLGVKRVRKALLGAFPEMHRHYAVLGKVEKILLRYTNESHRL